MIEFAFYLYALFQLIDFRFLVYFSNSNIFLGALL